MENKQLYRFEDFELNATDRLLQRNGDRVVLAWKGIELLVVLVRSAGNALSKEQLIRRVWPDVSVGESSLPKLVGTLREALGRDKNGMEFVETIPKFGYRFRAPVEAIDSVPHQPVSAAPVGIDLPSLLELPATRSSSRSFLPNFAIAFLAFAVASAGVSWFVWRTRSASRAEERTIAVVGFRNISGQPESAWMSVALEEMFRTDLSSGRGVSTPSGEDVAIARSELRLADTDTYSPKTLSQIRRRLDCDLVLSGAFAEFNQDGRPLLRLDIAVQDARDGSRRVSLTETGTESDLPELVASATQRLTAELGVRRTPAVPPEQFVLPRTAEGRRLYMEALAKWRAFDPLSARDRLIEAEHSDPDSPLIHSLLAECWELLGYQNEARKEAGMASEVSAPVSMASALVIQGRSREISGEFDSAIQIYRSLSQSFPEEFDYGLMLARAQTSAGHGRDALATLRTLATQGRATDPRLSLAEASAWQSVGEFGSEITAARRAEDFSRRRGESLVEARALQLEGWALDNLGRRAEAESRDSGALGIFAKMGDRDGQAKALKNLADVRDNDGDHAGAAETYKRALTIFEALGNSRGVALCLNNMAYALKDLGNLQGAQADFSRSLRISREIADRVGEARALNGVALVLWRRGDLENAARNYQLAIAKWREIGDRENSATVMSNLAIVFQDQRRFRDSRVLFEQAESIERQLGKQSAVARIEGDLGDLMLLQGDSDDAEHQYLAQMKTGEAIQEPKQESYAEYGLGEVLRARGRLTEALAQHEQAYELRRKSGEKGLMAESALAIAEVEFEQKHWERATTEALNAAKEFRGESERDQEARAMVLAARIRLAEGQRDAAKTIDRQVLERVTVTTDRSLRTEAAILKAELSRSAESGGK